MCVLTLHASILNFNKGKLLLHISFVSEHMSGLPIWHWPASTATQLLLATAISYRTIHDKKQLYHQLLQHSIRVP